MRTVANGPRIVPELKLELDTLAAQLVEFARMRHAYLQLPPA